MDAVIPFVDYTDNVWMETYISFMKSKFNDFNEKDIPYQQYSDHNTLKYVFRGIDKFMPYIENIFLVVSNIEQVPDYIDQSKIKVILHKDFIPEKYLPTFQPNTIELCMYKIPGLNEEFVYFNDDTIPVSPIKSDEVFKDGLPCINFSEDKIIFERFVKSSFYEGKYTAQELSGKEVKYDSDKILCPVHGPIPHIKSICLDAEKTWRFPDLLDFYISPIRSNRNINQYYWSSILYFLNKYIPSDIKVNYITTQKIDELDIEDTKNNYQYLCINDFGSDKYNTEELDNIITEKLNTILPDKCKYEK